MENDTNKPSFLEELNQSVRTKDEVEAENNRAEAERKVRAEIEADRQMNETVNQWIEKIKKEITERAKNGEFESVWDEKEFPVYSRCREKYLTQIKSESERYRFY